MTDELKLIDLYEKAKKAHFEKFEEDFELDKSVRWNYYFEGDYPGTFKSNLSKCTSRLGSSCR